LHYQSEERIMADARDRMVFEATEEMKRAIRMRAAMDGGKPTDVINAALEKYLEDEIALVRKRLAEGGQEAEQPKTRKPRKGD
jgi:hypothetical protein